jgi:formate hydrogenlyase subunit 3/multisubunit Na+/H+ antiporter MnhD subunit
MILEDIRPIVDTAVTMLGVIVFVSTFVFLFRLRFFHQRSWKKFRNTVPTSPLDFFDDALNAIRETEAGCSDAVLFLSAWLAKAAMWPLGIFIILMMGFWWIE